MNHLDHLDRPTRAFFKADSVIGPPATIAVDFFAITGHSSSYGCGEKGEAVIQVTRDNFSTGQYVEKTIGVNILEFSAACERGGWICLDIRAFDLDLKDGNNQLMYRKDFRSDITLNSPVKVDDREIVSSIVELNNIQNKDGLYAIGFCVGRFFFTVTVRGEGVFHAYRWDRVKGDSRRETLFTRNIYNF